MISSIHYPKISIKDWRIDEESEKYNIIVLFPKNTGFTCDQLCLIEQINQYLIGKILIQPYDDRTEFITEIYKTENPRQITVDEIRIIQRRIDNSASNNNNRKRVRENNPQEI